MAPQITVLMSVYKEKENFVKQAIDSILNQTFGDFEFLIRNDNPCDLVLDNLINEYVIKDSRIVYKRNKSNIGLAATLNKEIIEAKGNYLARMDADDIAMPNRFEKQIAYIKEHEDIAVLGSWAEIIDEKNQFIGYIKNKCRYEELFVQSFISSPLVHPSVMINKSFLYKYNILYNEEYSCAQDYDLWVRILINHGKIINLPLVLLKYRQSVGQVTAMRRAKQIEFTSQIHASILRTLSFDPLHEELQLHLGILLNNISVNNQEVVRWLSFLIKKCSNNLELKHLESFFKKYIVLIYAGLSSTSLSDLLLFQIRVRCFSIKAIVVNMIHLIKVGVY